MNTWGHVHRSGTWPCNRTIPRRRQAQVNAPRPRSPLPALLAPQRTQQQRETVGVELYGYQQTLAKLQNALDKARDTYAGASSTRCACGARNGGACAAGGTNIACGAPLPPTRHGWP